ncbi:hypothetical protein APH_1201 [Anaplasma phagocytophilum str. HZ]|uniref:Uncharacterized protein n=1 Tax=Anaplasma phagocytophilum (strain HZ) TaxID=212042 RepID=Q2GIR7_ANAPZ|nr:hypothetical protein APH_1201 [Anaplasma phagocytophilum str. HZ]
MWFLETGKGLEVVTMLLPVLVIVAASEMIRSRL